MTTSLHTNKNKVEIDHTTLQNHAWIRLPVSDLRYGKNPRFFPIFHLSGRRHGRLPILPR